MPLRIKMFSVFEICRRILKSYGFSLALLGADFLLQLAGQRK